MKHIKVVTPFAKSSYSGGGPGTDCVEVANAADGGRAVRDSKNPAGPVLQFTPEAWKSFIKGTRADEFESLAVR